MKPLTLFLTGMLFWMWSSAQAGVYTVEGEMGSKVTAYLTKRFKSAGDAKGLTYTLHLPSTFSEGMNIQMIEQVSRTTAPPPTDIEESVDEYGNRVITMSWNKSIRVVQIDLQFTARLYSNFYPLQSESPYPVPVPEEMQLHLASTPHAPAGNYVINYIAGSLSRGLERERDVVVNLFLWLDRHITLARDAPREDALSVLSGRRGSERGICNLAAALLKGIGIPVRVVYGVSFQREIRLDAGDDQIYYDYPNGDRYWVEVFFPDTGWVSYDPLGTYFAATSHLIKLAAGPDAAYAADRWEVESGSLEPSGEYIYDVLEDASTLRVTGVLQPELNKMVLSAPVQFEPARSWPTLEVAAHEAGAGGGEGDERGNADRHPSGRLVVGNTDTGQRLDVTATTTRVYGQRAEVEAPMLLTSVRLSLIKFSDDGTVWVELYDDAGRAPGSLLHRTIGLSSTRIRHMMIDNPWLDFPLRDPPELLPARYWVVLRWAGSCIFNWNACGGNVLGDEADTRFLDLEHQERRWGNLANLDLNFELVGASPRDPSSDHTSPR
jgi:transglutaminase-like putative cysteine protease